MAQQQRTRLIEVKIFKTLKENIETSKEAQYITLEW
jgi:hypothetical protein